MHINRWKRAGIVISVVWLALSAFAYWYEIHNYPSKIGMLNIPHNAYEWVKDVEYTNQERQRARAQGRDYSVNYYFDKPEVSIYGFLAFSLKPVILGWIAIYLMIAAIRWINGGKESKSTTVERLPAETALSETSPVSTNPTTSPNAPYTSQEDNPHEELSSQRNDIDKNELQASSPSNKAIKLSYWMSIFWIAVSINAAVKGDAPLGGKIVLGLFFGLILSAIFGGLTYLLAKLWYGVRR